MNTQMLETTEPRFKFQAYPVTNVLSIGPTYICLSMSDCPDGKHQYDNKKTILCLDANMNEIKKFKRNAKDDEDWFADCDMGNMENWKIGNDWKLINPNGHYKNGMHCTLGYFDEPSEDRHKYTYNMPNNVVVGYDDYPFQPEYSKYYVDIDGKRDNQLSDKDTWYQLGDSRTNIYEMNGHLIIHNIGDAWSVVIIKDTHTNDYNPFFSEDEDEDNV
jgi:hypothetical protein